MVVRFSSKLKDIANAGLTDTRQLCWLGPLPEDLPDLAGGGKVSERPDPAGHAGDRGDSPTTGVVVPVIVVGARAGCEEIPARRFTTADTERKTEDFLRNQGESE